MGENELVMVYGGDEKGKEQIPLPAQYSCKLHHPAGPM